MQIEEHRKRTRLLSDANTEVQELPAHQNISVDVKPLEDPDCPPELSLDLDSRPFDDLDTYEENSPPQYRQQETRVIPGVRDRQRSKSLDTTFTILGFMERKLRERIMSEELSPTWVDTRKLQEK